MDEWVRYVWVPDARLTTDITQAAELRALLTQSASCPPPGPGAADATTLFWFRWITGHQISFVAWIVAVDVIDQANRGSMARLDAQIRCRACLRLYSLMLIYAASTTVDIYQSRIRPAMIEAHPAFSATWAADYIHLKRNLRNWLQPAAQFSAGSAPPSSSTTGSASDQLAAVKQAYLASTQIHGKIGKRLIGNSASLLKLAKSDLESVEAGELDEPETRVGKIYDDFFLAVRSAVSVQDVVGQTVARLLAVVQDYRQHGFDLLGPDSMTGFDDLRDDYWAERDAIILSALDCMQQFARPNSGQQAESEGAAACS
jgi:hypothetical protein